MLETPEHQLNPIHRFLPSLLALCSLTEGVKILIQLLGCLNIFAETHGSDRRKANRGRSVSFNNLKYPRLVEASYGRGRTRTRSTRQRPVAFSHINANVSLAHNFSSLLYDSPVGSFIRSLTSTLTTTAGCHSPPPPARQQEQQHHISTGSNIKQFCDND